MPELCARDYGEVTVCLLWLMGPGAEVETLGSTTRWPRAETRETNCLILRLPKLTRKTPMKKDWLSGEGSQYLILQAIRIGNQNCSNSAAVTANDGGRMGEGTLCGT